MKKFLIVVNEVKFLIVMQYSKIGFGYGVLYILYNNKVDGIDLTVPGYPVAEIDMQEFEDADVELLVDAAKIKEETGRPIEMFQGIAEKIDELMNS